VIAGANKGIGLAIVQAILEEHDDTFVHLGSRDVAQSCSGDKLYACARAPQPSRQRVHARVHRDYGSDAQRSPLDRYRSPGSAPYTDD
jgi:NAD(P)-dependent dehydrogenase (short-subunit alcohol dehydrogenase family)